MVELKTELRQRLWVRLPVGVVEDEDVPSQIFSAPHDQ